MPKFRVVASVVGSKYLGEFEAATKEEAEQLALDSENASVHMCHQCSSQCEDAECAEAYAELIQDEPHK